jgi:glycine/D-amino acid oxidase-like deaminating enzyme
MHIGIVGGGIFGCSAALELARRGHRVELFERAAIPAPDASGTDISKVIRMEYGDATAAYAPLVQRALARWRELEAGAGRVLLHNSGVLFLCSEWDEARFEHKSVAALRAIGESPQVVDADQARTRWPQFNWDGMQVGVFNPVGGWLESSEAVRAAASAARAAGATLNEEARVADVSERGAHVTLRVDDNDVKVDVAVVAAGVWVAKLLDEMRHNVSVTRQQVSLYRPSNAQAFAGERFPVWVYDIVDEGWYGFPATDDGTVKVSLHRRSESADPDVSREASPAFLADSRAFVGEHIPALDPDSPLTGRACLYANSARGDLVVDRAPGHERVYIAGMGSGHGFKFGPVLGELVADLIERDEVPSFLRLAQRRVGEVW